MSFSFPIYLPIMKNNYGQMVVLLMRRVGWGGVGRGPICQGLMKRNTGAIVESLYKTELQLRLKLRPKVWTSRGRLT